MSNIFERLCTFSDLPQDWKDEISKHFPLKQTKGMGPAVRLYKKLKKEVEVLERRLGEAFRAVRSECSHPIGMLRLGIYSQEDTYGCNCRYKYTLFCTVCGQYLMQGGEHNGGVYMRLETKGAVSDASPTLRRPY